MDSAIGKQRKTHILNALSSPFPRLTSFQIPLLPTLLSSWITLSPFNEATSGTGGWGQDIAVSIRCSFFLTFSPVSLHGSSMGCTAGTLQQCSRSATEHHLVIPSFPLLLPPPLSNPSFSPCSPPPHFFLPFHKDTTNFMDWLSCDLRWVCCRVSWNQLCLAWGSPWPFFSEATPEPLCYQTFAIYTQCNSKFWKERSLKASRNKRAKHEQINVREPLNANYLFLFITQFFLTCSNRPTF